MVLDQAMQVINGDPLLGHDGLGDLVPNFYPLGDPRARAAFFIVQANREHLGGIARLIDQGRLRQVLNAVFLLAQARRAYEHRVARGKIVLSVKG